MTLDVPLLLTHLNPLLLFVITECVNDTGGPLELFMNNINDADTVRDKNRSIVIIYSNMLWVYGSRIIYKILYSNLRCTHHLIGLD